VSLTVFQRHKLIPHFNISLPKLRSFLAEIEHQYKANPYHNAIHAADVVHTVNVLIGKVPADTLSGMELLTCVFAAGCHDVGHDGVTNAFRIAALDEGAITYNDQSINENFHCSLTYRILQRDECNWLDSLTRMQSVAVRKLMIEIILSTDMANHFTKLAKVKSIAEERGGVISKWESPTPCMELMVHAADISNPSKPMDIALQWSDRVLDEFFQQGDRERTLGREISPLCDRYTVSKPGSQCFC
jgi:cAMP-specific phosphodiesterase 4